MPHLYCNTHPSSTFFFRTTKRTEAVSTTIGTSITDMFLLHVVMAAPCVFYTLCFVTSLDLVSTPSDDITENLSAKLPATDHTDKLFSVLFFGPEKFLTQIHE